MYISPGFFSASLNSMGCIVWAKFTHGYLSMTIIEVEQLELEGDTSYAEPLWVSLDAQ